jgi:hypothetical protein
VSRINIANKISCCTARRNIFLYFAIVIGQTMAAAACHTAA